MRLVVPSLTYQFASSALPSWQVKGRAQKTFTLSQRFHRDLGTLHSNTHSHTSSSSKPNISTSLLLIWGELHVKCKLLSKSYLPLQQGARKVLCDEHRETLHFQFQQNLGPLSPVGCPFISPSSPPVPLPSPAAFISGCQINSCSRLQQFSLLNSNQSFLSTA